MNNTMKAGIFAAVIVLFASLAMLAAPVSADGDGTETVEMKEMTAENFLALAKDGKIVMDSDVKLTSALVISGTIELDLAGHKLVNGSSAHTIAVSEGGKLTVNDSKTGGIVDNVTHGKAAVLVDIGGEATLNGGTFERSAEAGNINSEGKYVSGDNSYYTILNHGKMTINSGVTVLNGDGVKTGAYSSIVSNGFYSPTKENPNGATAEMTINGGTFIGGKYVKNDDYGVMTINGGTFQKSFGGWAVFNANTLTITDGNFETWGSAVVALADDKLDYESGILTITGGKFTCGYDIVELYNAASYTLDIAVENIAEGQEILYTYEEAVLNGKVSVNKNLIELKNIKTSEKFTLTVGSIDIGGTFTASDDGSSIIVKGDAKLSGTIDSAVTVKVESGSITVPAGKTLTGTIQMGEKNSVVLTGITAGNDGLTVTPSTIGGSASAAESGSIAIEGTVSVASALKLDKVTVTVPEKSELSVPKGATVSGGKVVNAGTVVVDGAVESTISNSGRVSAAVDAKVSDVEGSGDFDQVKPVIERKVFDANVPVGGRVTFAVTVTDGASVKLTGANWATYKDGMISGNPTKAGEYKITATPFIGDNIGDSITFIVNVYESADPVDPVDPVEPEKEKKGGISAATILVIVILIALAVFAVTRFI